jgi:tungstate transport system permease protein
MNTFLDGLAEALRLIASGDPALLEIVALSLRVSGVALLVSALLGIPFGAWLGLARFHGRRLVVALVYTGMAFPPVVVGLFVYLFLSRSGPLGSLNIGSLVAGFTMIAVMGVDPALRVQLRSLGASQQQVTLALLAEARTGVIAAVVAGFGGIISEVGAVMLVGGNIEHRTRVLTTAIVLETNKGNFDRALALGAILLLIAFVTNFIVLRLQGKSFE